MRIPLAPITCGVPKWVFHAAFLAFGLVFVPGCSAGAVQQNAICDRGSKIDAAIVSIGSLPKQALVSNAEALRNEIQEDINALVIAAEVTPDSLVQDFTNVIGRLRTVYGAFETLAWDSAIAATDADVESALTSVDSPNTRRHLARIAEYLIKKCSDIATAVSAPADSVVETVLPSTSMLLEVPDRVNPDPSRESEDIALGYTVAESLGLTINDDVAQCLGKEIQSVSNAETATDDREYSDKFAPAFRACGIDISTTTLG